MGSAASDLDKLKSLYEEWARGDFSGGDDLFHPEISTETFGLGSGGARAGLNRRR